MRDTDVSLAPFDRDRLPELFQGAVTHEEKNIAIPGSLTM